MLRMIRWFAILLMAFSVNPAAEEGGAMAVGDPLDLSPLENQHGEAFSHQRDMEAVIFLRGMETKDMVHEALADIDTGCMADGRLVYVADISKMPGFISRMVAIPKMRDYAYPVWLDREGETTAAFPAEEDAVSLLGVTDGRISHIQYLRKQETLVEHLEALCGTAPQP